MNLNNQHDHDKCTISIIVAFAIVTFACHIFLTWKFAELHVYKQWDVLFGSDTRTYLGIFERGWAGRDIRHPNISTFINPPVRVLASLVDLTGLLEMPLEKIRKEIVLLVVPLASAIKIFFLGLMLFTLGATRLQVFCGLLLGATAFSQIIFGTIPESYGISGMLLMIAFFLFVKELGSDSKFHWWAWISVGVLLLGTTITNIVIVGLLFIVLMLHHRQSFKMIMKRGVVLFASIIAVSAFIHYSANQIYKAESINLLSNSGLSSSYNDYSRPDIFENLTDFPRGVIDSIVPEKPVVRDLGYQTKKENVVYYNHVVTLKKYNERNTFNLMGVVVLIIIFWGIFLSWRSDYTYRSIMLAALSILLYNAILHSLWGSHELFLYSQHWLVAVIMLLIMPALSNKSNSFTMILLVTVAVMVGLNSIVRIQQVFELLNTVKIS